MSTECNRGWCLFQKNGESVWKRQFINKEASSGTKLLIVHTFEIDAFEDSYFCSSGEFVCCLALV
jgi:hypothetical protein